MTEEHKIETGVFVDTSVFIDDVAIGRLSGTMQFSTIPQIGDSIHFTIDICQKDMNACSVHSISLKVISRIFDLSKQTSIMLELSPIIFERKPDAIIIAKAIESRFNLFLEIY